MNNPQLAFDDPEEYLKLRAAWERILKELERDVPAQWFERFLSKIEPVALTSDRAEFNCPGRFVMEWITARFSERLETMVSDELGRSVRLVLHADNAPKGPLDTGAPASASAVAAPAPETESFRPQARFSFENYVIGDSNRLAYSGAKAVAETPGGRYNPLFIYGPSGLGKTHLLHAIGREIIRTRPGETILYMSAQQFAEEFVMALQANRIEPFRRAQRNVGVYLLDDIQLIAGRDKTLEEVFHTYNHLHHLGKQIVITSDRPPRDLHLVDERLRSRFEAGLVADVKMPDTETRCAIVMAKADADRLNLDFDVAMFLAENVPGNIRVLEGALTRLVAEGSVGREGLSVELAQRMVQTYYRPGTLAKPGADRIITAVGKHFSISPEEIRGPSRKAPIVHARHIAVYITRELTHDSWKHIGGLFGDRDHTSMMHGYQKISEAASRDRDLEATLKTLMRTVAPEVS